MRLLDRIRRKSISPPDARSGEWYYEQDNAGNHWYLNHLHDMIRDGRLVLGDSGINRIDFDMRNTSDKVVASRLCTPFASVVGKCGDMLSNGRIYIMDANQNESPKHDNIRALLNNPNPLQDWGNFSKEIEKTLKAVGYCPIYAPRAISTQLPPFMSTIMPELFHLEWSGVRFGSAAEDLISRAYIKVNGFEQTLDPSDYFIILDGEVLYPNRKGDDITFDSITSSLTHPVNNWMAQMIARHNLIVNGGPKGIIHGSSSGDTENAILSTGEKDELQSKFKGGYGLVNKINQILVSKKPLGWIPLTFKTSDLMLHEESKSCREDIANAIGLNPNVFLSDSTYANQNSAKKSAYEDLIIPDANRIAGALTKVLCPDGISISIDYSHLSCMQENRKEESEATYRVAVAMEKLVAANLISREEARQEISRYMEINPLKNG